MQLTMQVIALSILALGAAIAAIYSSYHAKGQLAFRILKPSTTVLLIVIVAVSARGSGLRYSGLIGAGLLFSLAGDTLLMLPPRFFASGLLSFLMTHVLYFLAFTSISGIALAHLGTPLLGIAGVVLATLVLPGVEPSLRLPVVLYTMVISLMAAQAIGAAIVQGTDALQIAAAGALFFYVSDATLAIDRFRSRFSAAHAIVLSSYWLGQWMIAISVS
jgi:uncharacterized membrane protein YhhN